MSALWFFPATAVVLIVTFELLARKTNVFGNLREPEPTDIRDDYLL